MPHESLEEARVDQEENENQLPPETNQEDDGLTRTGLESLIRELPNITSITLIATKKDGSMYGLELYGDFQDALLHQAVLNDRVEVHRAEFIKRRSRVPTKKSGA